ncbi:MAG: apolipoprotein acyltransferase [Rhodobacteraceae bacterium]|nr:MAG: apolipoprotein acyltransferase [Paracoccaceae bacterium]
MLVLIAAVIGGIIGGMTAKRRGGQRLDIVQYVGIYALAFALAGFVLTLIVHRMAL